MSDILKTLIFLIPLAVVIIIGGVLKARMKANEAPYLVMKQR